MKNVGIGVKDAANAVSAKVLDGAESSLDDVILHDATNVLVIPPGLDNVHGRYPTIVRGLQQTLDGRVGRLLPTHHKHFGTIPVVPIQITGNVQVDNVALLQLAIVWNAVANHLVD